MSQDSCIVEEAPTPHRFEEPRHVRYQNPDSSPAPASLIMARSLDDLLSLRSEGDRKQFAHDLVARHTTSLDGAAVDTPPTASWYPLGKRVIDIVLTAGALLVLLPVFAVISLAIVLDSRGPVLYYQDRVGLGGRTFRFYKFRSMCQDADAMKKDLMLHNEASGPIFKMRNDPRVTRVGRVLRRYSIDELPQLLNVLFGHISLIGPRPMVTGEAAVCDARQWQRHSVRPGLLCLREICGRSGLSFEEWVELDLLYIANRSFWTDVRILLHVVPAVLRSAHAY